MMKKRTFLVGLTTISSYAFRANWALTGKDGSVLYMDAARDI